MHSVLRGQAYFVLMNESKHTAVFCVHIIGFCAFIVIKCGLSTWFPTVATAV